MNVNDFDYVLPQELIAQEPAEKRDSSRLLVVHRDTGAIEHRHFCDIIEYLEPGDCLVLNDSKVIPARLYGIKEGTGAHIEFLLSKKIEGNDWETLVRPGKRLRPGDKVAFGENKELMAEIIGNSDDGTRIARFTCDGPFMETLERLGSMPLPPYIERESREADRDRYQTVYAKNEGSVACPTAGLHFTPQLLEAAEKKGVKIAYLTLHVGIGTFRPVKEEKIEDHHMHIEEYTVTRECADMMNETKKNGGRIISVGTTACRTMESAAGDDGMIRAESGNTGIFIYPGYKFKMLDCLITNFHLPKSTLLMLVSALYDREKMLQVYNTAVKEKYRFFSYGDAMLIL